MLWGMPRGLLRWSIAQGFASFVARPASKNQEQERGGYGPEQE